IRRKKIRTYQQDADAAAGKHRGKVTPPFRADFDIGGRPDLEVRPNKRLEQGQQSLQPVPVELAVADKYEVALFGGRWGHGVGHEGRLCDAASAILSTISTRTALCCGRRRQSSGRSSLYAQPYSPSPLGL